MPKQPESRLVANIRTYLERRGACVFKIHGGDPFQEVGIPDILCCYKAWFLGLEVKMPGEDPTPRQRAVLNRIGRAGGVAEVVRSVAEVERILAKLDRKR